MQLITLLSSASAMAATAAAATLRTAVSLNADINYAAPHAKIVNRCDYDVHIWSVYKGLGCPTDGMVTLKKGESYAENYENGTTSTGVSIKISKTQQCKNNDIVQLEYYLDHDPTYHGNYLDVSYVDCENMDCPTRQEGYYLVAGNQTGAATAGADNTWCPILSCDDPATCDKMSYVLPDDVQTKTCDLDSSMEFYMCGGEAPSGDDSSDSGSSSAAPSSTEQIQSSTPVATSTSVSTSSSSADALLSISINVAAASVTPAPESSTYSSSGNSGLTKTQVVYVTAIEYVNAKRHAHGHARRHQPFHA